MEKNQNSVGVVLSLYISKQGNSERLLQESIVVDEFGVLDDKFYDKDKERAILLTSVESYTLAKNYNIIMREGTLGENILIDFNPYTLPLKCQLKIGTIYFEVTQNCTICNHLSFIDKKLPKLLKDDRGIFIRALNKGSIEVGDKIYII